MNVEKESVGVIVKLPKEVHRAYKIDKLQRQQTRDFTNFGDYMTDLVCRLIKKPELINQIYGSEERKS